MASVTLPKMQHSRMLFVDAATTAPIKFFIRPSGEKAKIRPLIEHGGGLMVNKCLPDTIKLVEPGTRVLSSDHNTISTKYILDCVEKNTLLERASYRVRIHGVSYSDISEEDSMYQMQTTERRMMPRRDYTAHEDEKIIKFIVMTKRYGDVKGNRLWKAMANSGKMNGRSWQSLKERFLKKIVPVLKRFNLTKNQYRYFCLALGYKLDTESHRNVPEDDDENESTELEQEEEEGGGGRGGLVNAAPNFTQKEDWKMLRYIFHHLVYEDLKSDGMWTRMEKSKVTLHSSKSMKSRFFGHIVPNINEYHLPLMDLKRLSGVIDLPSDILHVGSEAETNSGDDVDSGARHREKIGDNVPFTQTEIWAMFDCIFQHLSYEDINGDVIWKKMETEKILLHPWKTTKDTFFNKIVPNIGHYYLPKHQLKRLASVVSIPNPPSEDSGSETLVKEECDAESRTSLPEGISMVILQQVLNVLRSFDHVDNQSITDFMWRKIEATGLIPYTWLTTKYHFYHHLMPNIDKYNLSIEDRKRLESAVDEQTCPKDVSRESAPKEQFKSLRQSLGAKLSASPHKHKENLDCLDMQLLKNLQLPVLEGVEKTNWFLSSVAQEEIANQNSGVVPQLDDALPRVQSVSQLSEASVETQILEMTPSGSELSEDVASADTLSPPPEGHFRSIHRRIQSRSEDISPIPARILGRKRSQAIQETESESSGSYRICNRENHIPSPPKQRRNTSPRPNRRQTLIERNSPAPSDNRIDCNDVEDVGLEEDNRRCISTNSIVLMETTKEGISDILNDVAKSLATTTSDSEQWKNCHTKLVHLQKLVNRALLSARVERIMDKSPTYMSFEDKLALYKFATFYKM